MNFVSSRRSIPSATLLWNLHAMVVKLISHASLPAANSLGYNPSFKVRHWIHARLSFLSVHWKAPTTTMHAWERQQNQTLRNANKSHSPNPLMLLILLPSWVPNILLLSSKKLWAAAFWWHKQSSKQICDHQSELDKSGFEDCGCLRLVYTIVLVFNLHHQ
jgi:hypothetical protein